MLVVSGDVFGCGCIHGANPANFAGAEASRRDHGNEEPPGSKGGSPWTDRARRCMGGAKRSAGCFGKVRNRCVARDLTGDRKSTRLNSSHSSISYAVFCL